MAPVDDKSDGGFEQYTGEVYGWAYSVLGHHHDALDVVQDVFLRWEAQCARKPPARPRGWLRRVTLNRAIDLHRRHRAAAEPLGGELEAAALPNHEQSRIDQETLRGDITVALDELSETQRNVLVAKVYDEMTFAQVAEELGLAIPTVKTHYLRAVRTVRERLQRRWAEE